MLDVRKFQEIVEGLIKDSERAKKKSVNYCDNFIFEQLKPTLAVHERSFEDDREMYKQETRLVIQAEEWGFDIVWPVEHHFFDYAMCPDNMQYLSYLAARTERIQLATGVIILPWNDPLRVVEKMVLLDHLSDGRAVLGLGRGTKRDHVRYS